ncbi:hypothetical protein [Streptomyces longispororuber]|uniref:hypothetical protein n=1 Tax=Streptomyces longispororuber TaxID=68230 RepID=UPI0021094FBD|nr:hypothetical protein [Streptomyces longispororuber]MCQ4208326.1 hypothetical protein [Streptomyces longispororuber]
MTPRRLGPLAATALAVPAAALLLSGCGDAGGLEAAGATPTAVGPRHLWPSLAPASAPADDYGAGETELVKGVTVPHGNLREVSPVAVVRAQVAAGDPDLSKESAKNLDACGDPGPKKADCPVQHGYYADLTGDGKEDLVVAIREPKSLLVVRVYMYTDRQLIQIMDDEDAVISVQLAGRSIVVRAVADLPGYEYRTSWSYDAHQRAMLPTRDEIVRTGPPKTPPAETPAPESPSPAPSASPSASPSVSPPAAPSPSTS